MKTSNGIEAGVEVSGDCCCPRCGAVEIEALTPRTLYGCGSSDYDGRPGTFLVGPGCVWRDQNKVLDLSIGQVGDDVVDVFAETEHKWWIDNGRVVPAKPVRPLRKHLVQDCVYVDAEGMVWKRYRGRFAFLNRASVCEHPPGRGGFFENVVLPQRKHHWLSYRRFIITFLLNHI